MPPALFDGRFDGEECFTITYISVGEIVGDTCPASEIEGDG